MANAMQNPQFVSSAIQFIQNVVTSKSIALNPKKEWQPSVMVLRDFEKEWVVCFNRSFKSFYKDHVCKIPDPRFSISMSVMTYLSYLKDPRYSKHLFPELPADLHNPTELIIFFPKEYTVNALELDLKDHSNLQKDERIDKHIELLREELYLFLTNHYPDYYFNIIPFGSRSYGAHSTSTDYNMCVVMDDPDLDWIVQNKERCTSPNFLEPAESEHMSRLLEFNNSFRKATFDSKFNTLRYMGSVGTVEFVFNKAIYTESTDMIQRYIELDDRVGKLIGVVKSFVQLRSVTKGGLPGYGFYQYCILVLGYLQQLDPPVIPNLQHLEFGNTDCCKVLGCRTNKRYWDSALDHKTYVGAVAYYHTCVVKDTTKPKTQYSVVQDGSGGYYWNSSNTSNLSELLLDFFYYYGFEFKFDRLGVSLRSGGVINKGKGVSQDIFIEDPFLTGVNIADPSKITRGLSFFLGAFLIMYNDEISFTEALRYGGLLKIPEIKKLKNSKMPYQALPKRHVAPARAVSFLLMNLPKVKDHSCLCDSIANHYRSIGHILHIETLDDTTKRVYIALTVQDDGRRLALPTPIKIKNHIVHVAKLYGFNIRN